MSVTKKISRCPHCGGSLQAFEVPEAGGWDLPFQLACFNDECPYYRDGWNWMWEQYQVKASYRYRVNPKTNTASPIAVWSKTALLDRIIEILKDEDAQEPGKKHD
ncbi:MAG: hypothetical protein V1754_13170 [Pseudomonadota bacterium]